MKFSWKNIKNWRSWKMRFFWVGHFEFQNGRLKNFFCFSSTKTSSFFIWGIIYFWNMAGFLRILEKRLSELISTRLYGGWLQGTVCKKIWALNLSFSYIFSPFLHGFQTSIFSKRFWPTFAGKILEQWSNQALQRNRQNCW